MKKTLSILLLSMALSVGCLSGCSPQESGSTETSVATNNTSTPVSEGSSSSSESVSTSEGANEDLKAALEKYLVQSQGYSVDGAEPIDVKSIMQGKKLFILPGNYTVVFSQTTCDAMKSICDELGVECYIYSTDGTTDSWILGMETAINQKYDAILCFSGVTMELISSQIEYAEEAGISVLDLHFHDFADAAKCSATYCLPAGYEEAGNALAMYAIDQAGADASVLIVTSRDLDAAIAMERGMESAFAQYAPNAKYKYVNVNCPEWATKIQPEVQNALNADPSIKYVITCFDSTLTYVTAAIEAVGLSGEVKCCGYNGTPFCLDLVNEGSVDGDLGECLELMAYCCLDQSFRILNGDQPLENENPPFVLWNSDNVASTLGSDGKAGYGGYNDSYKDYYKELWGLK